MASDVSASEQVCTCLRDDRARKVKENYDMVLLESSALEATDMSRPKRHVYHRVHIQVRLAALSLSLSFSVSLALSLSLLLARDVRVHIQMRLAARAHTLTHKALARARARSRNLYVPSS